MTTKTNANCCGPTSAVESETVLTPRVDIFDSESEARVYLDLPGVARDDLSLRYEDGELHVEGKQQLESDVTYLRQEFRRGTFQKSFSLGESIDTEGIDAELKDGVLVVRLPKSEASKTRKIEVKSV